MKLKAVNAAMYEFSSAESMFSKLYDIADKESFVKTVLSVLK